MNEAQPRGAEKIFREEVACRTSGHSSRGPSSKASSRTITIAGFTLLHRDLRLRDMGRHGGGAVCGVLGLQLESASSAAVTVAILVGGDAAAGRPTKSPFTGSSPPSSGCRPRRDRRVVQTEPQPVGDRLLGLGSGSASDVLDFGRQQGLQRILSGYYGCLSR